MAVLPDSERVTCWAEWMRDQSAVGASLSLTKAELRAAINALDDWIDANAAAFNSALPLPARTALTAKQKASLLMAVSGRRFGVL